MRCAMNKIIQRLRAIDSIWFSTFGFLYQAHLFAVCVIPDGIRISVTLFSSTNITSLRDFVQLGAFVPEGHHIGRNDAFWIESR